MYRSGLVVPKASTGTYGGFGFAAHAPSIHVVAFFVRRARTPRRGGVGSFVPARDHTRGLRFCALAFMYVIMYGTIYNTPCDTCTPLLAFFFSFLYDAMFLPSVDG